MSRQLPTHGLRLAPRQPPRKAADVGCHDTFVDFTKCSGPTRRVSRLNALVLVGISVVAVGCSTSPDAPLSSASLTSDATVRTSRSAQDFATIGGGVYHRWTITLGTIESCTGDTVFQADVETLSSDTSLPIGTHMFRTDETTIASLPSAYARYAGNVVTSGSLTIESADATYIYGSISAMVTIDGVPTAVTGAFGAPVCK